MFPSANVPFPRSVRRLKAPQVTPRGQVAKKPGRLFAYFPMILRCPDVAAGLSKREAPNDPSVIPK